ncbi:transposase [Thiorhodospira sibirica]|uniref:transposase n=1 Tax=Thiorhodospira sibirica TaxID=154347 RepID=UPI001FE9918C|nr:transposase [Thiorhodospira sibirica]
MIEGQTANTVELSHVLVLETERQDMREPWLRRLLKNPLVCPTEIMQPLAMAELAQAARHDQTLCLSLDQTDLGDRMALLVLALRVGERALPLVWWARQGAANIGCAGQKALLETVLAWLPAGARVLLLADLFYPSATLFAWLHAHEWGYRLRLKGNLRVDTGVAETTTGDLAKGVREAYFPGVRLFASGVVTHLGIVHESGHPEPWMIAMDADSTRARVLDYATRWGIEPMFSDFKGRGLFGLGDSHLRPADRLERRVLIMALAMYGCVRIGRDQACHPPTPLEKNPSTGRSEPLALSQARPQPGFVVLTWLALLDALSAKRPAAAGFSCP